MDECELNNGGCSISPFVQCINTGVSELSLIDISINRCNKIGLINVFLRVRQSVALVRLDIQAMADIVFERQMRRVNVITQTFVTR